MICALSGSTRLLDLPKPALMLMSIFGLSAAEMLVRVLIFCCWRGWNIACVTGTLSTFW